VVKFIQLLPLMGRWTKVTWGLQQLVLGIQPFAPFTYHGLVEFLVLVEDELDNLGDQQLGWQHVVNQLIFDILVKPTIHHNLPNTLVDRMMPEHRLMRTHAQEEPKAIQYGHPLGRCRSNPISSGSSGHLVAHSRTGRQPIGHKIHPN